MKVLKPELHPIYSHFPALPKLTVSRHYERLDRPRIIDKVMICEDDPYFRSELMDGFRGKETAIKAPRLGNADYIKDQIFDFNPDLIIIDGQLGKDMFDRDIDGNVIVEKLRLSGFRGWIIANSACKAWNSDMVSLGADIDGKKEFSDSDAKIRPEYFMRRFFNGL